MEYRPDELLQENDNKIPDEPEAEVKDLRFEEAVGQQEFDNLEEDQEGGAQQAFDPLEGQEDEVALSVCSNCCHVLKYDVIMM